MLPKTRPSWATAAAVLLSSSLASAACLDLKDSRTCSAWKDSQVSLDLDNFSFLSYVTDVESFDKEFDNYLKTAYITEKFESQFGCGKVDFNNATEYYARFTRTTICSALIQASKDACGLNESQARPVCADSCAQFAQSEAYLSSDESLCSNPGSQLFSLIRADFVTCSLPDSSLSTSKCIPGSTNEPDNCGFRDSTLGLCSYCSSGGVNSTDTCCYAAQAEERCKDVELPSLTATLDLPTDTPAHSDDDDDKSGGGGLSGGAIAGIVIGVLAALGLLGMLLLFCLRRRRRAANMKSSSSIFNQPTPSRQGMPTSSRGSVPPPMPPTSSASMAEKSAATAAANNHLGVIPGGRVARMSALEHASDTNDAANSDASAMSRSMTPGTHSHTHTRSDMHSMSDSYTNHSSPFSGGILRPPPTNRRNESLSGSSGIMSGAVGVGGAGAGAGAGGSDTTSSPRSGNVSSSSPNAAVSSQQSEQLPFFKDYYSQDDIHPGDPVSVLWAYEPRANDEFSLARGDMLKIVGIWDDGWATGIMLEETTEEWEAKRQAQRDSGLSTASGAAAGGRQEESPPVSGEIKAFPLVCVCLPQHWRSTITRDVGADV